MIPAYSTERHQKGRQYPACKDFFSVIQGAGIKMYYNSIQVLDDGEQSQSRSFLKVQQAPACNLLNLSWPLKRRGGKVDQNLGHKRITKQIKLTFSSGLSKCLDVKT